MKIPRPHLRSIKLLGEKILHPGLIRGFLSVGAIRMFSMPFTLTTSVVLARSLGPVEFGHYSFMVSFMIILSLPFGLGIVRLTVRETALLLSEEKFSRVKGNWRRGSQAISVYAVLVVAALLSWIGVGYESSFSTIVFICLIPILSILDFQSGILRGLGKPAKSLFPTMVLRPLGILLCSVIFMWTGVFSIAEATISYAIGTIFALAWSFGMVYKSRPQCVADARPEYDDRPLIRAYPTFLFISAATFMTIDLLLSLIHI